MPHTPQPQAQREQAHSPGHGQPKSRPEDIDEQEAQLSMGNLPTVQQLSDKPSGDQPDDHQEHELGSGACTGQVFG